MRLTEEEVRGRLTTAHRLCREHWDALSRERTAINRWWNRPMRRPSWCYPAALRAIGVRWTGEHYEESPDA